MKIPSAVRSLPIPPLVPPQPPATGPSIRIIYHVVLSRQPVLVVERWNPQNQLKTLVDLHAELPFNPPELRGLIFTIDSPCLKMSERISNGDEEVFTSMKRCVNWAIQGWLRQQRTSDRELQRIVVDIYIERMREEGSFGGSGLDEFQLEW